MILIPVKYGDFSYPPDLNCNMHELSATFAHDSIKVVDGFYSLHTEYSFGAPRRETKMIKGYNNLYTAHCKKTPLLWHSKEWAIEFSNFIKEITNGHKKPTVIEIHPPYKPPCSSYRKLEDFLVIYNEFAYRIKEHFPEVIILIENRAGTTIQLNKYGERTRYAKFMISEIGELNKLSREIDNGKVNLKIALDLPQLFSAHGFVRNGYNKKTLRYLFESINTIKHNILGIHLWGIIKEKNGSHKGNLNDLFNGDKEIKEYFLEKLVETFNDDIPRFFVPEVNSNYKDFLSIINDLVKMECKFEPYIK